eukprot:CAMPEP_0204350694 /NCGR_PEP_ID=MMETSP0469-20131031/30546_1 /ASSEMBLY_ACC=CAM_ASM_000384 /TAXON_ID=2969 /ORGANISM="Oxyrrhis marina" /LENGTH=146 /DNA_ID=CAMNT_0051337095 /DNA_START=52 /DNA_END=492 /DNA_ORIENTATION=+
MALLNFALVMKVRSAGYVYKGLNVPPARPGAGDMRVVAEEEAFEMDPRPRVYGARRSQARPGPRGQRHDAAPNGARGDDGSEPLPDSDLDSRSSEDESEATQRRDAGNGHPRPEQEDLMEMGDARPAGAGVWEPGEEDGPPQISAV